MYGVWTPQERSFCMTGVRFLRTYSALKPSSDTSKSGFSEELKRNNSLCSSYVIFFFILTLPYISPRTLHCQS